ncbi:hypothetical protein [Bradyrhizobium sp. LA6.7]|uniref:alpha/beta hydrolase n=1 Tax=unclassified Bradyrhizobium TaxID=2631580 RepID=UPI0033954A3C
MSDIGYERFNVAGHDRGARVTYRMALDLPERLKRLPLFDVIPTASTWEHGDTRFALSLWPWLLLAQPAPL